jgi:NADPH-dependent 2,4-dienoyl-CoA reductase/sulfur reductase-like enzyme
MTERLVIVGGDAAGMSAGTQARRRRDSSDLEIVAFERGPYTSYSACGIPYFVGGTVAELDPLIVRSPEEFETRNDIQALVRHEVTEIDLEARKVRVRDLENSVERNEGFDQLMIATGALPIRPRWEGADADGIFDVQVLGDGVEIRDWITRHNPRNAVVIGAGYIGIEMAEALMHQGMEVAVVTRSPHPMSPTLDEDMGAVLAEGMRARGIDLWLDESVEATEEDGERVRAVVTEARTLPADVVVMGLGVEPNTALAERTGLGIGSSGGIRVDRQMRTTADGVWSGGDCAEKFHLVSRRHVTIPLGTHANKEGRVAGTNIGGGDESFPGVLGTAVTKVCDIEIARTGLSEAEASNAGIQFISDTTDSTTTSGYLPGAPTIKTKLVVERGSGKLLGAQILGKEGAAKRIDVLATALWNEMTVAEIINLDLSYAPPFAPVWDPVLVAARSAQKRMGDS